MHFISKKNSKSAITYVLFHSFWLWTKEKTLDFFFSHSLSRVCSESALFGAHKRGTDFRFVHFFWYSTGPLSSCSFSRPVFYQRVCNLIQVYSFYFFGSQETKYFTSVPLWRDFRRVCKHITLILFQTIWFGLDEIFLRGLVDKTLFRCMLYAGRMSEFAF